MISKRRFSLPRLDITGMWVFSLGVWFHIVARLVSVSYTHLTLPTKA